jgi:hypothetical protein
MNNKWTKTALWDYILILHGRKIKLSGMSDNKSINLYRKIHLRFEQILDKFNHHSEST